MIANRPIHVMVKPTGATCNLDCTYCYYVHKEDVTPYSWKMTDEVLEAYVRQYLAANAGPEAVFAWQGGEPTLMGLATFEKIITLQEHYRRPEQHVVNTLQTNGTLLNDDWANFLHKHQFLVGISVDGPADLHDQHRVDKGGKPTCAKVMAAIQLLKRHRVEFNILCTVNSANAKHGARVYRFLREHTEHLQFIPVIERSGDPDPASPGCEVTDWSVSSKAYGTFLTDVFDAWFTEDVGRIHVQLFEAQVAIALGQPAGLCVFNETCGDALVLERDGGLYSCDHFVYPTFLLGSITEHTIGDLANTARQAAFGNAKRDALPTQCKECRHRHRCQGECPKHRFATTATGEAGLSYLCGGYYHFFEHTAPRVDAIAAGLKRGIPAWDTAKGWGGGYHPRKTAPNAPCPCGSNRKFKKCCGA